MSKMIYFDNSATTKISDEALDKYIEASREYFANPSSLHSLGFIAEGKIKSAREAILETLRAKDDRIVFCGSGSEANNLAIFGRAFAKERFRARGKIITTVGEHSSVSESLKKLEKMGYEVAYISTRGGVINLDELKEALTGNVILVSVMMVNNETGALYDVSAVSKLTRALCKDAIIHVDCTQSYLKVPFTKASIGADLLTLSSHKIEGPKGVGALVIDKKVFTSGGISPIIVGGGQEDGLRSGTENVPAICAFETAAKIGFRELSARYESTLALRSYLIEKIKSSEALSEIYITEPPKFAPHIVNITVPNIKSETLLHFLSAHGIFVSSGSACSSNSNHSSSALISYGHTEKMADSSVRISFSHRNTAEEIDEFISILKEATGSLARIKK